MPTFATLLKELTDAGIRRTIAVPEAADDATIEALHEAAAIATGRLFGRKAEILAVVRSLGLPDDAFEIVDTPDEGASLREALQAIRRGECGMLMKGKLATGAFLKGVLNKEWGLRKGALLSHVLVAEWRGAFIHLSDGGMNIRPTVDELVDITRNALDVARDLGHEAPTAALLSATPEAGSIPEAERTALELSHLFQQEGFPYWFEGALPLDDMFAFDSLPDVMLAPNIETGNLLGKSMSYLYGMPTAGLIAGAAAPVIMLSRADDAATKLHSIALASKIAEKQAQS